MRSALKFTPKPCLLASARWIASAGVSMLAVIAPQAAAQNSDTHAHQETTAQEATSTYQQDEIIVTARRRDERLQDVPLAVTAVTSAQLQSNGILSVGNLSKIAPTLTSTPSPGGGRSSPNFGIRGLSQQELSILGDQSVSAYLGDVVIARVQGLNAALFDIGSVEILRGPQGTLFGRNTTGGAVVIRPNKPTDGFEGLASATIGSFGTFNTEGMLNVPLGDGIKLRLAGMTLHDDGYVYDELLGRNVNDTRQQAARASLLLEPVDGLEVLTTYDYFRERDGGVGSYVGAVNPAASNNTPDFRASRNYRPLEDLLAEQNARGIYRIANGTPAFVRINTHLVANTLTYHLSDQITLKNVIAYRHVWNKLRDDLDGTESAIFPQERRDKSWQFSEEFQVIGDFGRFNWIAGGYYFRERGRLQASSVGNAVDPGAIEYEYLDQYPDLSLSTTDIEARNISYAAFAQGTYEIVDGLNFTAGIRYNRDDRRSIIRNRTRTACRFTTDGDNDPATPETTPPLDQCVVVGNKAFSEPTYNLSLDYKFANDKLVYIAHRHGYRSGGFGSRATSEAGLTRTYAPETVDDFEFGLKTDWNLGSSFLRANIAAYYAKYNNFQRILTDTTIQPTQSVTVNAGNARIQGLEMELLFRPIHWLEFTANYAYTDAKFITFITPTGEDLSNSPVARAPKNVYTIAARATLPVSEDIGDISVGGSLYHQGSYNADDAYVAGLTDMPSYELVNLDVNWRRIFRSSFDLSASITNLTKTKYSYYIANLFGLGVLPYYAGEPRRFSVSLRYHFNR